MFYIKYLVLGYLRQNVGIVNVPIVNKRTNIGKNNPNRKIGLLYLLMFTSRAVIKHKFLGNVAQ